MSAGSKLSISDDTLATLSITGEEGKTAATGTIPETNSNAIISGYRNRKKSSMSYNLSRILYEYIGQNIVFSKML